MNELKKHTYWHTIKTTATKLQSSYKYLARTHTHIKKGEALFWSKNQNFPTSFHFRFVERVQHKALQHVTFSFPTFLFTHCILFALFTCTSYHHRWQADAAFSLYSLFMGAVTKVFVQQLYVCVRCTEYVAIAIAKRFF